MFFRGLVTVICVGFTIASPQSERSYTATTYASQSTCDGKTFTYEALAGYGFVTSDARDKFGDTINFGSSIAIEPKSWQYSRRSGTYSGILWGLPDRGWNTNGTLNYQNRVHKFSITLTPVSSSTTPNLVLKYLDSVLLYDPVGKPMTGLDATTVLKYNGFPDLPAAKYVGDGFGGPGKGDTRASLDSEGLVLDGYGGFWISDEYGPYIYHFNFAGRMIQAIRPPNAFIPLRNGTESFSADSPPLYDPTADPIPANPTSGRANNQGLEGLTMSPDGRSLYALMQSALIQEGGSDKTTNNDARLLKYDIASYHPKLAGEWIVQLPFYTDPTKSKKNNPRTAAQSEIHALPDGQFFVLARDSNFGHGGSSGNKSNYRHIDVFTILDNTTDISGAQYNNFTSSVTTSANVDTLAAGIVPVQYCPFLDFNNNTELAKFGLHNGDPSNQYLLNEKWESIAIVPVDGREGADGWYYVFSASDNDFITQNGYYGFGKYQYKDATGLNLDNQVLVFKVQLPVGQTRYSYH